MKIHKSIKELPWPKKPGTRSECKNFTMYFAWPVVDHERLLVITFQRNPKKQTWCHDTRDFRLVLSKKEQTVRILFNGNSRAKRCYMRELLYNWGTSADTCYPNISDTDEQALMRWLGIRKSHNHCIPELRDWVAAAINREVLAEKDARGELRDEDVDLCPEELPEGLAEFIRQEVLTEDRVLLYKKGNVRGTCFVCGQKVKAVYQRFRQTEFVDCPRCGTRVRAYLETSSQFKVDYVQNVATMQVGTDGKTVFFRQWHIIRDHTAKWRDIPAQLQEVARYAIRGNKAAKWQHEEKHCYFMNAWRDQLSTWTRVTDVVNVYDGSYEFFLPPNWQEQLAGTSLQYIDLDGYYTDKGRKNAYKNIIRFAVDWARYPSIEKLWKAGYTELIHERIRGIGGKDRKTVKWRANTIPEAVGVPLWLMKRQDPQKWNVYKLTKAQRLYAEVKAGTITDGEAMQIEKNGVELDVIRAALGHASVGKILRYLDKQVAAEKEEDDRKAAEAKAMNHYYYRHEVPEVYTTYRDYLRECAQLELNLDEEAVLLPRNLQAAHARTLTAVKHKESAVKRKAFNKQVKKLEKMMMEKDGLLIRPAKSASELIAEGKFLHHCVGGYADRMANGTVAIFLIRKMDNPDVPFFTLEYTDGRVVQCKTKHNSDFRNNPQISAFVDAWVRWVKGGCKQKKKATKVA